MSGLQFFPHSKVHQHLHHLHVRVADRFPWYHRWHRQPHANHVHWATLAVYFFGVVAFTLFYSVAQAKPRLLSLDLGIRTSGYEYGRSQLGNPLYAYSFGSGAETVFVVAAIHGNERSSALLAADLVNDLVDNPNDIPPDKKIVIIPIANPDGYQRKWRANYGGIDVNRNFGSSDWRRRTGGPGGSSAGGRRAFSEKESAALKNIFVAEGLDTLIALHARGNLVNPEAHDLSKLLAQLIAEKAGLRYLEQWGYYQVTGTMTLWTVEQFSAPSVTWELSSYTDPQWERNKDALLAAIRY